MVASLRAYADRFDDIDGISGVFPLSPDSAPRLDVSRIASTRATGLMAEFMDGPSIHTDLGGIRTIPRISGIVRRGRFSISDQRTAKTSTSRQ